MTTARTVDGLVHKERIEEMDRELTKVVEGLFHAVNVEALCLAKTTGKHPLSLPGDSSFSVVS